MQTTQSVPTRAAGGCRRTARVSIRTLSLLVLLALAAPAVHAQATAIRRVAEGAEAALNGARAAKAARGLGAIAGALPESEITGLAARCGRAGGLEEVGKILGAKMLGNTQLEDAYLRMAVANGRLDQPVAQRVFSELGGTPGLRTLARKVNSVSGVQAKGHLQELLVGLHAKERGMEVVEFGRRFDDGVKRAPTDIDLVLGANGRQLAIESKAYVSDVPMDVVRQDAVSLEVFCKANPGTRPAFCFGTRPSEAVRRELSRRKIDCVDGDPEVIAAQLERLITL